MNIFISHSAKDGSIVRLIKNRLEAKNFHILNRQGLLELFSSPASKGKRCIDLSDVCVVLYSPNGKGSYIVHQEVGYINAVNKDHFILDSHGAGFSLKEIRYGKELPVPENERLHEWWATIRMILQNSIHDLNADSSKMIYHTDIVLE